MSFLFLELETKVAATSKHSKKQLKGNKNYFTYVAAQLTVINEVKQTTETK